MGGGCTCGSLFIFSLIMSIALLFTGLLKGPINLQNSLDHKTLDFSASIPGVLRYTVDSCMYARSVG